MAAGSIVISLLMKTGAFETDTKRAEKRLKELEKTAHNAGKLIGIGISAGAAAITALTAKAINFADELNDISHKTGVSAETLSAWAYAAEQSGTSIDALSAALPKFSKNVAAAADETSKQSQMFRALGIDVKDAQGNLRKVEDLIPEVADRFKALNNETTETALAMELFGKSGAELKEFLENGSSGLRSLTDRAAELGVVIGNDTVAAADEFKDKLSDLKAIALGFGLDVAAKLLPALNDTVDKLIEISKDGTLAANAVEVISAAFSAGVGVIDLYNRAVASLSIEIERIAKSASGLGTAIGSLSLPGLLSGANPLDRLKVAKSGFDKMLAADEEARKQWEQLNKQASGRGMFAGVTSTFEGPNQKTPSGLQDRLNKFFATGGRSPKPSKSGGKSDAEREAERLLAVFDRQKAAMDEQIALYGQTTRAAQVRYDVEHGELTKLTQAQKDELILRAERLDMMDREKDLQERLDRETEAYEQMNDLINEQIGYLGMTADEQEIAVNLARAGVDAESARGKIIIANTQALQAQREAMNDQIEAMDSVRDAGKDFLYDWTSGSKSFKDSFLDALDSIHQRILQMIAENLMDKLFGKQGDSTGGSAGGWLASIAGALFGGARASGGEVRNDRAYLVGEQGPEMFVPRTAGTIIPAGRTAAMAGGRSVQQTVNFAVTGRIDRRTQDQIAADLGRKSSQALRRNGA